MGLWKWAHAVEAWKRGVGRRDATRTHLPARHARRGGIAGLFDGAQSLHLFLSAAAAASQP